MSAPASVRPADDLLARLGPVGLGWHVDGRATYRGPLLELLDACDRAFRHLARRWAATEERHPVAIAAAALDRTGYLDSFPHLATFTVALDDDEANLDRFGTDPGGPVAPDGAVRLARLAPTRELLAPAACYHLYAAHAGEALDGALVLTIRNTCVRREAFYEPLRRQHMFDMREIVCLGPPSEVDAFLDRARRSTDALVGELDLPVGWQAATDPFFRSGDDPRQLFQRLHGTKQEAVHDGDLAIASANRHGDHFGAAFGITAGGSPACSGCVGFGLDRWLFALTDRYGVDPDRWPDVPAAARRAWSS